MEKEIKMPFNFIESQRPNVRGDGTNFRMTIMYHPRPDSTEIRMYEKRFVITDVDALNLADSTIIEKVRKDAAIEVFEKFYEENFIKGLHPLT